MTVCLTTCENWMKDLGFSCNPFTKNSFVDGHEREDVVKYRDEVFVPQMLELIRRMKSFENEQTIEPEL